MEFIESKIIKGIDTGFMIGKYRGLHTFTRTKDGKKGLAYCDGVTITLFEPEDVIWHEDKNVSTKGLIKGVSISHNNKI